MMLSTPGAFAAPPPAAIGYLVTNDDYGLGASDTATFFTIAANGTLSNPTLVNLGGEGTGGGYFASSRVSVLNSATTPCVYLSAGSTNTIAGVEALTQTAVGDFPASATDNGADNGIGMVMNGSYLYASFSTSATLATFAVQPGCGLQFLNDISPAGLNGGTVKGMALNGDLLAVPMETAPLSRLISLAVRPFPTATSRIPPVSRATISQWRGHHTGRPLRHLWRRLQWRSRRSVRHFVRPADLNRAL